MKHVQIICRDCRWWNPLPGAGAAVQSGECRRYPPSVLPSALDYHSSTEMSDRGFPLTGENDWCGEAHY
jgi:hypothetical protein